MKRLWIVIIVFSWCSSARSEYEMRLWHDKSGDVIEAEYVRTEGEQVVIKTAQGTQILKVSIENLSDKDRRYVSLLQPHPSLEIKVSTDVDRSNKTPARAGFVQIQKETIGLDVKIRKTSAASYDAPLKAEIFLFGQSENGDVYVLLNRTIAPFQFGNEDGNEFSVCVKDVTLEQFETGVQSGIEYEGYLVAIRDANKQLVSVKGNKSVFEENAEVISHSERGAVFNKDFEPVEKKQSGKARTKVLRRNLPVRDF
ncbi:MAG TPA: SHD1 domain-containing protein [Pontiella sp.]